MVSEGGNDMLGGCCGGHIQTKEEIEKGEMHRILLESAGKFKCPKCSRVGVKIVTKTFPDKITFFVCNCGYKINPIIKKNKQERKNEK